MNSDYHVSLRGFFEFFFIFIFINFLNFFFKFLKFFLIFLKCPRVNSSACHILKSMF